MIFPGAVIGGYSAKGVTFDGSNDYLSLGSSPTGLSDQAVGLLSFWINGANASANAYLFFGGSIRFRVLFTAAADDVYVLGDNTSGTNILGMNTSVAVLDSSWHHVLAAWDTSTSANCKIYVDGVDRTTLTTRTSGNIDYTFGSFYCGASNTGSFKLNADVAEVWFSHNQWLDITSSANRAKFASSGRPVTLGSDGSRPTGTAPIIYFKGPASNWGTNAGTGGNFTVNGAFTDAATKPSY